jgi:release factor H-coupled RctB family protein
MQSSSSSSSSSATADPSSLLVSGPGVWMESDATAQLANTLTLEGCVRAVGMPDLHPGSGHPIGAAVATRGVVHPHLIGGDAGCGARLVVTTVEKMDTDRLEKRLNDAFDEDVWAGVDPAALFEAAWFRGGAGLCELDGIPEGLRRLAEREREHPPQGELPPSGDPDRFRRGSGASFDAPFAASIGSIGGGNHFAEVSRVSEVADREAAARVGLLRNAFVVLAHSGSRGLGTALGLAWKDGPVRELDEQTASSSGERTVHRFLGELAGACRYARANRLVLTYRLLSALGALRDHTLRGGFDIVHNDVRAEAVGGEPAWVHRKGVAPAYADELTVVLGSRGAPSWIMRGTGAEHGLRSVAHGAGRRMTRSEAQAKLKHKYKRAEVSRSALGGRTICDDSALLFEEHPDAYKAIEPVVAALEAHQLASRVAALTPVVTVKRA